MKQRTPESSYTRYVEQLKADLGPDHTDDEIMELAVGGSFEAMGIIERELLIQQGLRPGHYLIDVGCGSGRLARPISAYLQGRYLGIDIVPELVAYARTLVDRPDWRFEVAEGFAIPEENGQADMICFFSLFTHLRHEESYRYLQEALRVLRPGGKIVFSFLEFPNPHNWAVFANDVATIGEDGPPNQFLSLDAIKIWAYYLGVQVGALNRAGRVALRQAHRLADGSQLSGTVLLGQSVCVLAKRPLPHWRQKLNNGVFRIADSLQRLGI